MENLIRRIKEIVANAESFACYSLNTKKNPVVGVKINLTCQQLKDFMSKTTDYLCDKVYSKMELGDYPESSPKDFIEKISCNSSLIKDLIDCIKLVPYRPETNNTNLKNCKAYMIVAYCNKGTYCFITKKNIKIDYTNKTYYVVKR